jgi:hypothetical protein
MCDVSVSCISIIVTSSIFHSVCVSLWVQRPYSVTYVKFKVLYIGRESDGFVTWFVGAFVSCVALRVECGVMNWYRRLVLNGVFQWTEGVLTFYGKGPHRLLWVGSGVVCGKITRGVCQWLNYCGLCPPVAAPCRKQNCTLNRSLGTLQLSRAALIVNVVSVAVL